jgi:endonuclease/exonuclease/phosphatase family metal-dependent hydrolase
VVLIQEPATATTLRRDPQLVDTAFDPSFHYYREEASQIPNGIISRYPIVAAGEWDDPYLLNRDFAWARIDVPGPHDLWAISVHFYAQSSTTRDAEAASLVSYIQANVPAEDYLVIGGDLNTGWRGELAFTTLAQVVDVAGPFPVDQAGNANTNTSRYRPYDHVLVDADLRAAQVPTLIGASTFDDGLVVDTRVYSLIVELWPALATDSAVYNMQHMAVIKDCALAESAKASLGRAAASLAHLAGSDRRWDIGSTQRIVERSVRPSRSNTRAMGSRGHLSPRIGRRGGLRVDGATGPGVVHVRRQTASRTRDAALTIVGTPQVF